ncbi:TolB family protein [Sinomonas sp. P10A9]|uniref:TolB family protein n=1 Tax=Sinomonas puerhi TaxID=3238584 RepID=A0AB39L443_9MICC
MAEPQLIFHTDEILLEAPNWAHDGRTLYVNGHGVLWSLDVDVPVLREVPFEDLPEINNDHVLSPDGASIYLSAMDGHIYRGALSGGTVERVTDEEDGRRHFLHGVRPDESELAWVELSDFSAPGRLAVGPSRRGPSRVLATGSGHADGPEWSPDGAWIYFNTEGFTSEPGHAQLARIDPRGCQLERLVASDSVDWFPHLSADGRHAAYVSFPAGTLGHPADLDVVVQVVSTGDWAAPLQSYRLFGGQGTLNVNSWAPDSGRFAFIAYPVDGADVSP